MILSSRVVKANQQALGRQRVSVDATLPDTSDDFEPEITEAVSEVVERAKTEARAILEQAEQDAVRIREAARAEGYQAGYQAGADQGRAEAHRLWDSIRAQLEEPLALLSQTRDYLARLNDESTLSLAAALSLSVYSRLRLERLDVIAAYIEELVSTIDCQKVTLFLDPTWSPRLQALTELLDAAVPGLVLAVDDTLSQGTMRAEGENGGVLGGPWLSLKALLEEVMG